MKAKILLLTIAIMISGISFSSNPKNDQEIKCAKKVIKKIKRNMNAIDLNDYMEEGTTSRFVITCNINNNVVELLDVRGINEDLKNEIIQTFDKYPVICDANSIESPFRFPVKFILMP